MFDRPWFAGRRCVRARPFGLWVGWLVVFEWRASCDQLYEEHGVGQIDR